MGQKIAKDKEKLMGLLFIGRFLEGKPWEVSMKRWKSKADYLLMLRNGRNYSILEA